MDKGTTEPKETEAADHGGFEPDNIATGKLAAITIILGGIIFVMTVGVGAWVMKVTKEVQAAQASVETTRIIELRAAQTPVLAGGAGIAIH